MNSEDGSTIIEIARQRDRNSLVTCSNGSPQRGHNWTVLRIAFLPGEEIEEERKYLTNEINTFPTAF
jgi:hypothetical protein